jgi:predicted nucleic acid-binding protein
MGTPLMPERRRIYLDANIFIHIGEGYPPLQEELKALLSMIAGKQHLFVTGEITLSEVLVAPLRAGNQSYAKRYLDLISPQNGILVQPIDRAIWLKAAEIRAQSGTPLPDAVHIACAIKAECDVFLTEDKRMKIPKPMEKIGLAELC